MVVTAQIWYWTVNGMTEASEAEARMGYVQVSEVERLLEEAHKRGREQEKEEYASRSRGI